MSLETVRRALIVVVVAVVLSIFGLVAFGAIRWLTGRDGPPYGSDGPASGWWASWAGDVDGDGARDLLVRRHPDDTEDQLAAVSSRTGTALWTAKRPRSGSTRFAERGCVSGDVDGDGVGDVVVNFGDKSVEILSGRSGSMLRSVDAPCGSVLGDVIALGDLDGDGAPEVLVDGGDRRSRSVVSCKDGRILHRMAADEYVSCVFSPGDVDGDGRADVAWWCSAGAECVRTSDGSRILLVPDAQFARGEADYDGDGRVDLLAMRNVYLGEGATGPADLWRQGRLEIVSGRTHAVLRTFDADALGLPR